METEFRGEQLGLEWEVLRLPIRDGNLVLLGTVRLGTVVLRLPIRDGNTLLNLNLRSGPPFLDYL